MRKPRIFPVGALILAAWFLFNPNITLFDLLPDFVAYALILYALRHLILFVPYMREASEAFRKLFFISLIKLPALVVMLTMATDRITITLFTLSFAVLEIFFLFPAISNLFEGLFYLGQRFGCESAIRDTRYQSGADAIRMMTYIFAVSKALLSTLPDFCFLFEYDPLTGKGMTITTGQYILVLALAFALALAIGIVWLTCILPYFRAISADEATNALSMPQCADVQQREKHRIFLSLPYFLFAVGIGFSIDLVADNRILLPDYLTAACFLALSILFFIKNKKKGALCLTASAAYFSSTILFSVYRSRFFLTYTESDIARLPLAEEAYLPVLVTAAISEILFVALFILLGRMLGRFYREIIPMDDPKNEYENRMLKKERMAAARKNGLAVALAVLSAFTSFLQILLSQFTKSVEMQPGYGGGAFYLAIAGSFWLIPFLLSLGFILFTAWTLRSSLQELYRAQELDNERISTTG